MLLSGSKHKALATKLASTRYSAHFVMRLRPNPALKRSAKSGLQGPVCGVAAFSTARASHPALGARLALR